MLCDLELRPLAGDQNSLREGAAVGVAGGGGQPRRRGGRRWPGCPRRKLEVHELEEVARGVPDDVACIDVAMHKRGV